MKRNVKASNQGPSLPNMLAKELLKHFGFPYLTAPGEAEAECALLQREGLVDAVMSEDVDTLMFGCGITMRDWSGEGKGKVPTHVSIYSSELIKRDSGLDREGMVLIALMSGGDYDTVGIPGCGPKVACQAAKAGFGKDLCKLAKDDIIGFNQWRERLNYELRTNESGYFQRKNKTIRVPDTFPNKKIFAYYARPVVSSAEKVTELRSSISWDSPVDVHNLRLFVADAFEWHYLEGAIKFIRGLAPALLSQRLCQRAGASAKTLELQAEEEQEYIKGVCSKPRTHFDTGGIREVRVIYIPADITGLDFEKEETGQYAGIADSDTEVEATGSLGEEETQSTSPAKKRGPSIYSPILPDKLWIPETIAKLGIPLMMENWKADMRNPKKFATRKAREKTAVASGGMRKGAMDAFVKVRKHNVERTHYDGQPILESLEDDRDIHQELMKLPDDVGKTKASVLFMDSDGENESTKPKVPRTPSRVTKKATRKKRVSLILDSPIRSSNANPSTLSRRPLNTLDIETGTTKRYSALGINCSPRTPNHNQHELSSKADHVFEQPIVVESPSCKKTVSSRPDVMSNETTATTKSCLKDKPHNSILQTESLCTHTGLTPQLNRRLNFTPIATSIKLPSSTSPPLPSPSTLLGSPPPRPHATSRRETATRHHAPAPSIPKGSKIQITLRKSLNGSWRKMEDWELEPSTPGQALSGVETLDLTRS